jgi:subfamily B ATP-binding cassette protein MsbA
MTIYQGTAAAKRIFAMIDEKIQIKDQKKLPNLKIENGNIEFENVSFQYKAGKESAVKNINLNIQGEKITALVGHSGAGKSTIMNLIPKFYQGQKGRIIIDDQDISNVSLYSLRDKISMVSQDTVLFDDTVENNIKFAKIDTTEEELVKACKLAVADDFISELPQKYQTIIGENGVRLSGGQKQRLSIARAILKNAPIILLDEATSSLDTESEEKVQNAIFNLTKNKTTLVIAHRLSTIKKSDNIIVMRNGNVVGSGKHDELMKNSKDYKNLYSKQVI